MIQVDCQVGLVVLVMTQPQVSGHDSAPGLNIMLLKQQQLSVSGHAADLARQHPPVEYVYCCSHPLLQYRCSHPLLHCWNHGMIPTLYVGRVDDLLGQVPLIPCFLEGNATSTIPRKYSSRQRDAFECCCADDGVGPT